MPTALEGRRESDEEDLPAQQPPAGAPPRLPSPHGRPGWPGDPACPPPEGPATALGVITSVRGRSTFRALSQAPTGRRGGVRARCAPWNPPGDDDRRADATGVAYAIGRRQGSAVQRNRIRRRLRAAIREIDRRGTVLQPGAAYLLMSGPEASTCPFPELVTWVEGALSQAGARSRTSGATATSRTEPPQPARRTPSSMSRSDRSVRPGHPGPR